MAGDTDMKPHEQTYSSVIALFKWGAVGVPGDRGDRDLADLLRRRQVTRPA